MRRRREVRSAAVFIRALLTRPGHSSKKVVALALGHRRAALSELGFEAKEGHIQSLISRAKSKGDSILASISSMARSGGASSHIDKILQHVYNAYEEILRSQNSVDFDDLLVFGVKLLKLFSVDVEHLFIDEL
jgi:DNA helicase-2/ATP-dependent DNA helicase PcrA